MKYSALFACLILIGCASASQPNLGPSYEEAATITCGNFTYDDVTRLTVMKRYNCLSNLQKQMLVPNYPYPDLYLKAIALRGVAAEQFEKGNITKNEFLAYGANIQSSVIAESRNRDFQEIAAQPQQPIILPQLAPIPQNPNQIHCNTYQSGQFGNISCR